MAATRNSWPASATPPWVSIGSDGSALNVATAGGKPHPRSYGTFSRVLGKYVRDEKNITLEDAVRKMTSLAAQQMGIRDRGIIREGMKADIIIFDPKTITDRSTFEQPHAYSEGVKYSIVNGKVVLDNGTHTGARPGRIIYGPGKK
jgi:N-acyl-D-amino-acid deacylase